MAAQCPGVLNEALSEKINACKILLVGAGGIGCEVLKILVLTGFRDIEIIDLDTIDVSNLNRQFLFRKEHIGQSKAEVAKESALRFNPDVKIVAHCGNVISSQFGIPYIKQFTLVMNALDNRAARNHMNRMCLAADVPLIESGTEGYLGWVTLIKKSLSECYECRPQQPQKTYPGCTIRNTPSEPIHCIVWAKHLFNQLFGEADEDEDVSPDTEDPELTGVASKNALNNSTTEVCTGLPERKSTRMWAMDSGYDPIKLFNKMFRDDIQYLLSMENLWLERRPPQPLHWDLLDEMNENTEDDENHTMRDQVVWSIMECCTMFYNCVECLRMKLDKEGEDGILIWDKDDDVAMDFVASAANIRAHIFGINRKSRFDIKSMAGNIIPAIATTNAIISGLVVTQAFHILNKEFHKCKTSILNKEPNSHNKLIMQIPLLEPNPKCYVCSQKPEATVVLNTETTTVRTLHSKILKSHLGMMAPDVEIDDGKGSILISSEEGETEDNEDLTLSHFNISDGVRLKCEDFHQNYNLIINISHKDKIENDNEFEVVGDLSELKEQIDEQAKKTEEPVPSSSLSDHVQVEHEEELILVEENDLAISATSSDSVSNGIGKEGTRKRKISDENETAIVKKSRTLVCDPESGSVADDSDIQMID